MDFSDALRALKEGAAVRRRLWTKLYDIIPTEIVSIRLEQPAEGWEFIFVGTRVDGRKIVWLGTNTQILADDWEIVPADVPEPDEPDGGPDTGVQGDVKGWGGLRG